MSAGRPEVVLAIIDDGFDLDHEDLPEAHPDAADFADGDDHPAAGPLDDHGTAVAGIALARAGNGRGMVGFCPGCSFLPIRRGATDLDDALAIAHAVDHEASVINCSWGQSGASLAVTAAIGHAAEHGRDGKGAVVVFAAGNGGDDIEAIADVSATAGGLAVMATGPDDQLRPDSNVGRYALAAPAGGQLTTDRTLGGYAVGPYTDDFGGTSGGAPVVSGTAALFIAVAPQATASEVRAALLETADRVADDVRFEGGALRRLHAGRALARADGRDESAFTTERCAMRALGEPDRPPLEADCAMRAPDGSGTHAGWWSMGAALTLSGLARRLAARRATGRARCAVRAR
ncbi:MAG: S8 family serine peptidase [Polyangiaceae bacterium]